MSDKHPIPDEALDSDIAILGKKGKGKTYTAKGIVERLLDLKRRVLVLDPLGIWWGLKSSADGESEGYPLAVFGGAHADVPLYDKSGRELARVLGKENIPAVIDMSEMRKAGQQRLLADLLDELFTVNRDPLTLVLEEADAFAPQQPMGDGIRVLGEVDRIARRGRAYGFRLISLCQRPAKLNKDVLTQLSTLVALGVTSPQDRNAIKAWVEGNADRDAAREVYESLELLKTGEGWVWAPDFGVLERAAFPRIKTLDTSATPKAGEKRIEPKVLARADIERLAEQLGQHDEDEARKAVVKKSDPDELRRIEQNGYRRGFEEGQAAGYEKGYREAITNAQSALEGVIPKVHPKPAIKTPKRIAPAKPSAFGSIGPAAQGFLDTAKSVYPASLTWGQLATLQNRKARGGSFNSVRRSLLDQGYIEERSGLVYLTDAHKPDGSGDVDLLAAFIQALPRPASDMLAAISAHGPIDTASLATLLDRAPHGGSWNTGMSMLKQNSLIRDNGRGWEVALKEDV